MKRFLSSAAAFLFIIAGAARVWSQAPAQPAPQSPGGAKGGPARVQNPATPEDIAELAKLPNLPTWSAGSGDGDYSTGPDYAPAPEEKQRVGIPHGKLVEFFMNSASSKIYPGTNGPIERLVSVYIPSQYVPGTETPFIFSADSYGLRDHQLANILDNMIADRRLPSMVAVMVANGGPDRSLEYDTVSPVFANFVETDLLPRVEKETGVKLTKNPEGRMTYGGSSGGAMALTMAWFRPDLYHRVLSYSGTFVNVKNSPDAPHGAYEYPEHLFPNNPAKPLRIWMHVSENDLGAKTASADLRNWLIANQRLAGVLKNKGYHYQFVFSKNSGHVDTKVIRQTLPQALEYVWQGFPITRK
ncbi:MAG: alpha/beta hydrolase-fold protein [Acidobacteriota bacterium]